MDAQEDEPKWDVALEAMVIDELRKRAAPLSLDVFRNLATQYSVRMDDIMETMFLLVIYRQWNYQDESGKPQVFTQKTLDNLYVKRRLSEHELSQYNGSWTLKKSSRA